MPDKKDLLAKVQADFDKAQAEFDFKKRLLSLLPLQDALTDVYNFGYCADGSADYIELNAEATTETLKSLLQALPPMPCTYATGSQFTLKPTEYLRPNDPSERSEAYPVTVVYAKGDPDGKAKWWTRLTDDLVVSVNLRGNDLNAAVLGSMGEQRERYSPVGHDYSTGSQSIWVRRIKTQDDLPKVETPYEQWCAEWDVFAQEHNYNAKQTGLMRSVLAKVSNNVLTDAMFAPESQETVNWCYFGPLFQTFTEDQVSELHAFALEMQRRYPSVEVQKTVSLDRAEQWLQNFFATHGKPVMKLQYGGHAELKGLDVLRYLLRKETGFAGVFNFVGCFRDYVEPGITLDGAHRRPKIHWDESLPEFNIESLAEYF